jgi:hypothetical protein
MRIVHQGLHAVGLVLFGLLCGCAIDGPSPTSPPPRPAAVNFESLPLQTENASITRVPYDMSAVYVLQDTVYFCCQTGKIYRMSAETMKVFDSCATPLTVIPRLLYVTSKGTIFISPPDRAVDTTQWGLYCSRDGGKTWKCSLGRPAWRMTEDDQGALYVGNYEKDRFQESDLYKSTDDGETWQTVFQDPTTDHVHTVGFDPSTQKMYMALGDSRSRGQLVSSDHGQTWQTLARGPWEGHTDLGFTSDYIFWGTDNRTGILLRQDKSTDALDTIFAGGHQYIWFIVADNRKAIYFGTLTSGVSGGEVAVVCGSMDQGKSWQKLIELPATTDAFRGFSYGCYHPTPSGYVFVSTGSVGYRLRLNG